MNPKCIYLIKYINIICGEKIMESKDKLFSSLIILAFIVGIAIGYFVHQPGTETKYINNTVEVPKIVEKIAETTASPVGTTAQPASIQVPDFEIKIYDPDKDKPDETIKLENWRAVPPQLSIRAGKTVLITVLNYPGQELPPWFIMGSYNKLLGSNGMIVIKFNKTGTYEYKAVAPNTDPSILPRTYAEGTITVYQI